MKVKARYFALFREQAGCESESIEWQGGTPAELFALATTLHASLNIQTAALVAVNDEMAEWETVLKDGDEILFFPPVAGG